MAFAFGSFVSEVIAILSSQLRNAGRISTGLKLKKDPRFLLVTDGFQQKCDSVLCIAKNENLEMLKKIK